MLIRWTILILCLGAVALYSFMVCKSKRRMYFIAPLLYVTHLAVFFFGSIQRAYGVEWWIKTFGTTALNDWSAVIHLQAVITLLAAALLVIYQVEKDG